MVFMGDTFADENRSLYDVIIQSSLSGLSVDSHDIARGFALSGAGIAVLPDILAEPHVEAKALRKLALRERWAQRLGEHQLVVVARADDAHRSVVKYFIERYLKGARVKAT